MTASATIVIVARNASATIQRAVRSAVIQGDYPILLIDDYSSDNTVELAGAEAGARLRVVRPPLHGTLGLARQTGLDAIETSFGVWLDSDDELLPGRVERIAGSLVRNAADLASDSIELMDGCSSRFLRRLTIPDFLKGLHPLARLFERNYLQGIGYLAFRREFAQRMGYDPTLHGANRLRHRVCARWVRDGNAPVPRLCARGGRC